MKDHNFWLVGLATTLLGKILWDWFQSKKIPWEVALGKLEKRVEHNTEDISLLRQTVAESLARTDEKLVVAAKQLEKGSNDFKEIRGEISEISQQLAVLIALVKKDPG